MVALLPVPLARAEASSVSGGAGALPPPAPSSSPAPASPVPSGPSGGSAVAGGRPVLTVFEAAGSAPVSAAATRALVRFQVRDASRRVRVRLAFVGISGQGTERVGLGRRRTGIVHSVRRALPPGSYRVRITAVNRWGRRAVRATTVDVAPAPAPAVSQGVFPVRGRYSLGEDGSRFGAPRQGRSHQGQDISAAEGTPVVAPKTGSIHWRSYQAAGAGYYLVLDADGEDFMYVFMHLRQGSVLVSKGDRVAAGQQIAQVGNTGRSFGAHLHFEIWQGAWYDGGRPIDPLPTLRAWEAG